MKKIIFTIFTCFISLISFGQIQPSWNLCPDGKSSCGPIDRIAQRTQLTGDQLQKPPFSFILHQEITRFSTNYSTGAFIGPNLIITAHHNVYNKGLVRTLRFCNKAVDPDKWITFRKRDVEIFLFGGVQAPTDIAVIKIKDPNKIKSLYKGHFEVDSIGSVSDTESIHLTGFPCDIPDVLVDKQVTKNQLNITPDYSLIGYYMYTCTGDSGAPLWGLKNNKPTIFGIHHGGGESYLPANWNSAARITRLVIDWINTLH